MTAPALVVERIAPPGWLDLCRCHDCGTVDSDGSRGPESSVSPQPLERDVSIARHSERWYCRVHSKAVWGAHIDHLKRVGRRLERLRLWRLGLLEWQTPRAWVQLELFAATVVPISYPKGLRP